LDTPRLSANNLDTTSKLDSAPNASLAIFALPDANSIAVAERVRERLDELKKSFPEDIDYEISLDMTPFIRESIQRGYQDPDRGHHSGRVRRIALLQNWRSALIP